MLMCIFTICLSPACYGINIPNYQINVKHFIKYLSNKAKTLNFTELQEKLKKKDIHLTNRKISEIWGMSEENVSRAKKGGWDIKHENIEKLEKALDISLIEKETITTQELKEKLNEIQKKLGMPTENITVLIPYRPYIFSYKDEIFIKRLVKNINQLIIIPENKLYDTIKLQGEELKEINIIGQIVGLMRDLR